MHLRLLVTSFPGFVPDLTETGEVQFKGYLLEEDHTVVLLGSNPLPMDRIDRLQLLHREKKDLEKCKGGAVREGEV